MASRCTLLQPGIVPYQQAWQLQQRIAAAVRDGGDPCLILLEHPPVYTLGVRAKPEDLLLGEAVLQSRGAEVHRTDRGGDVTFHGPGQLVAYPILDIRRYDQGPSWYVHQLEALVIDALDRFGIRGERSARNPGVWVDDAKIAAIGVRVSRGVTTHGFALNVNTDLRYFDDIVPCGLPGVGVTSMRELRGEAIEMDAVMRTVSDAFARRFDVSFAPASSNANSPELAGVRA